MSRAIMGKCPLSPRSGVATDNEQWVWRYCFYPPHRGVRAEGTASDFAQARVDFEIAWREMQPDITEADFVEHRRERTLDVMEGPNVGRWLQARDPTIGRPDARPGERGAG
jgi:hypothetical protein